MKLIRFIAATTIFIIFLTCIYMIHVLYFQVNVLFFSAIWDVVIAAAGASVTLWLTPFRCFGRFEKALIVIVWLLSGYTLAISVPTVIDRSLSFYILEKLQQRGGAIRQDKIEGIFVNEYVTEHRLVDVRLTEQLESGTIVIQNGCVQLTEKGEKIASFGRYFRKNWLPKKRLLMGEYSDALTDPFRDSTSQTGYKCRQFSSP
jgi:hypothetical protein